MQQYEKDRPLQKITLIAIVAAAIAGIAGIMAVAYHPFDGQADGSRGDNGKPVAENQTKFLQGTEFPDDRYLKGSVTINDRKILVDIAGTQEQKSKGLDIRDSMPENEGMLFVFDDERPYSFWMKGMKFPIDIIWINGNYTVVHVEHALPVCDPIDSAIGNCKKYTPDSNALYVLETVAGYSEKYGVKDGTKVKFALDG